MPTITYADNCPTWVRLQVEASLLLLNTPIAIKDSLENLPWIDVNYKHRDEPAKLLEKHNMFIMLTTMDDKEVLEVVRGEEEILVTAVFSSSSH